MSVLMDDNVSVFPFQIMDVTGASDTSKTVTAVDDGGNMTDSYTNGENTSASAPQSEFLTCCLCHTSYSKPKLLPCLHTFCQCCIDKNTPVHSLSVTCLLCRYQSILPPDGVEALHDNTFITQMMKFIEQHRSCSDCAASLSGFCEPHSSSDRSDLSPLKLVCRSHDGHQLTHYCQDCETVFCGSCSEHSDHQTEHLALSTVASHLQELKSLVSSSQEGPVVELGKALTNIQMVNSSLAANYDDAKRSVFEHFETLMKCVVTRRDLALAELDGAFVQKEQALKQQAYQLNQLILTVNACCKFALKTLDAESCDPTQVLVARKELADRLKNLATKVPPTAVETDCLTFDVQHDDMATLQRLIYGLGHVGSGGAVPFETTVKGDGMRQCWPNKPAMVTITAKDRNGDHIRVQHSSFTAKIFPATSSSKTVHEAFITEIVDNADGTCDLSYIVRQPGTFLLEIQLCGHPIRGSPFRIRAHHETTERTSRPRPRSDGRFESSASVGGSSSAGGSGSRSTKNPSSSRSMESQRKGTPIEDDLMLRIGTQGRNKGEFLNPQGVAFYRGTAGDRILITDSNSQCIQVFSASSGECLLKFGSRGRLPGQLQRPTGVAVTQNGNYLVADYDNKWVAVYSADGKYINRSLGVGKLLGPKGVCVDSHGRIVIVDNRGSCIHIYQQNGRLVQKFGSRSSTDPRHLAGPHFCALTPSGRDLVVTDFHNHCVKVFELDTGTLKFSFGSAGEGNGQFGAPTGCAVDKNGNILVADWGNNRIQVFDSEGSFLSFVNTAGDPLYGPQGLTLTDDGNILVADSGNHCFKIYRHLLQ